MRSSVPPYIKTKTYLGAEDRPARLAEPEQNPRLPTTPYGHVTTLPRDHVTTEPMGIASSTGDPRHDQVYHAVHFSNHRL